MPVERLKEMIQKRALVTLALLVSTFSIFGQGTVLFDTKNISTGSAQVIYPNGTGVTGTTFSAQLYSAAGDQRANLGSLTAAETRVHFRSGLNAGFVAISGVNAFTGQPVDQEVTVTPAANGPATVQFRVWDSTFSTYEAAVSGGGMFGASSPIFLGATGGGLLPAVELTGLEGLVVPEPGTLTLAALALGAFLIRRRR